MKTGVPLKPTRVVVSAGDPSGDLILAQIIGHLKEIYATRGGIEFVGLCGPASEAQGVKVIARSSDVAVVGLVEVLANLRKLFGILNKIGEEIKKSDSLLCVDFPDFNLRLAEIAAKAGKPVDYVVAPQVWVWRSQRVHQMKRLIRKLYPALPFEEQIFQEVGLNTKYLGHPIRDLLPPKNRNAARAQLGLKPDDFTVALLPGSRRNELKVQFPLMIQAWAQVQKMKSRLVTKYAFAKWKAVLAIAPGWTEEKLLPFLDAKSCKLFDQLKDEGVLKISIDSREALMAADFGWITSGTATLEAALYQLPHILVYRLSRVSAFMIGQMTSYFSRPDASAGLPNILLQKKVIPELLQGALSARSLAIETIELLGNPGRLSGMRHDLRWLPKKLGEVGSTERIATDLAALWSGVSVSGLNAKATPSKSAAVMSEVL